MKRKKIIIIGAGPCGLGAAWRLTELGTTDFELYEQNDFVGGLATSVTDNQGFIWDLGGHVLHSHYTYFDEVFEKVLKGEYFTHQRSAWIWMHNRFVPYPLQNNLRFLPLKIQKECLDGIKSHNFRNKPAQFADWLYQNFGKGITENFLYPYNSKIWAYPLEKMNYTWVGDRVARVDKKFVMEQINNKKNDTSWGPNNTFKYPYQGTGYFWKKLSTRFSKNIQFNKKIVRIDLKKKRVWFADGNFSDYGKLLTTMPLSSLLHFISDEKINYNPDALFSSSVTFVGLGIRGKVPGHLKDKNWIYFSDTQIPFFRLTVLSNYSPKLAPKNSWSLLTENSFSNYNKLNVTYIEEAVIKSLRKAKILRLADQIVSTWVYTIPFGYPVPTLARDQSVHKILAILEKHEVYSRGRFGSWLYEVSNQDHTFMQGVEWANRMMLNEPEITIHNPNVVNHIKK